MKKLLFLTTVCLLFHQLVPESYSINAIKNISLRPLADQVTLANISMQEGTNTVQLKGNKGTLTFLKKAHFFSNVKFTNAAGKTIRLMPATATKPTCTSSEQAALFGDPETVLVSICRQPKANPDAGNYSIKVLFAAKK